MDTWYSKDLGDGVDAYAPTKQIQDAFVPLFSAAGCPVDMAVFSRYDLRKNVVTVYFSPSASQLAGAFGAVPCGKPTREELGLLVGDQRCWDLFYPASEHGQI
jgi:hypothetical protein